MHVEVPGARPERRREEKTSSPGRPLCATGPPGKAAPTVLPREVFRTTIGCVRPPAKASGPNQLGPRLQRSQREQVAPYGDAPQHCRTGRGCGSQIEPGLL